MRSVLAAVVMFTALSLGGVAYAETAGEPAPLAPGPAAAALRGEIMLLVELGAFSALIPSELVETPTGRTVFVLTGTLVSGSLLSGVLVLIRRRRRGRESPHRRLLEVGRRMARACDTEEVARIARVEAMALTRARHGAYIEVHQGTLVVVVDADGVFLRQRLGDGLLGQVADTGRLVNTVTADELSIRTLPAAILAVPVMDSEGMRGIIALLRSADEPFSVQDADVVSQLAQMVAPADAAAQRHDPTGTARIDDVGGRTDRRAFEGTIVSRLASVRPGRPVAVAMIEIDRSEPPRAGDTHGDDDAAFAAVAEMLADSIGPGGVAYRHGDTEFALVLMVDSRREALDTVERLRRDVESARRPGSGRCSTVSIGLAVVMGGAGQAAIAAADAALYMAKARGGNRVEIADDRSTFDGAARSSLLEDDRRPA